MRVYGQCMVILPDRLDEIGGSDSTRWYYPTPDEYGGQHIETGPLNTFDSFWPVT